MGSSRGKQQETTLQNNAAADRNAWVASPLENKRNEDNLKFLKQWDDGTDVRQIDRLKPYLNLYDSASNRGKDEQGVGVLGFNALSGGDGGNKMGGLIGQQLASRRQENASGQLYNAANQAYDSAQNEGNQLMAISENRNSGRAGLSQQAYTSYLNRPQKPSIWETLLKGGLAAGAAYAGRPGG